MGELWLEAFGSSIGAPRPLADLLELDAETRELLLASGLRSVPQAEQTPPRMARESILRTLDAASVGPEAIGTVLWSSTSIDDRSWITDEVSHVLAELGLAYANVIGVTLGECGNLGPALRVAQGLADAGGAPSLMVFTDAVSPGSKRLVPPSATVLGDGAVSCIAGSTYGAVSVEAVAQVSNHLLRRIDPLAETVRTLRVTAQGVKKAAHAALQQAGIGPQDLSCLLLTNQNTAVRAVFARQCGVPVELVRVPSIAAHAHLFAGDILAGLDEVTRELNPGNFILAIANGTCTWSGIVLRVRNK